MPEPWYLTHDDGTPTGATEAILQIERQLRIAERLHRDIICVTCGKHGVHAHSHQPGK